MNHKPPPPDIDRLDAGRFKCWSFSQEVCSACALCAGSCPVAGIDGFDPRKLVRMVSLGMERELVEARWPWICTMCGRCEQVCPMQVGIPRIIRSIRSLRPRDQVPGILHKGVATALKTGNNLGIPGKTLLSSWKTWPPKLPPNPASKGLRCPSTGRARTF